MGARIDTFTPDLIHDFDRLKTLFSGEKELAEINQLPEEALVCPYFTKWRVAWMVFTIPYATYAFCFLKSTSYISYFPVRSLSNRLDVLATHQARNIIYLIQKIYLGSSLWVPSINLCQWNLSDVYNQSSIKRSEIQDPRIRSKLTEDEVDYHIEGLCRGGTYWFNFLLLKKLGNRPRNSETIKKCAIGVAKQFEKGQPRQAALMQSLHGLEDDLLDLKNPLVSFDFAKYETKPQILSAFKDLQNGIYQFYLPKHAVSLIKCAGKIFIWDSNSGLISFYSEDDLFEFISKYTKVGEKIFYFSPEFKGGFFSQAIDWLRRIWNMIKVGSKWQKADVRQN